MALFCFPTVPPATVEGRDRCWPDGASSTFMTPESHLFAVRSTSGHSAAIS